MLRVNFEFDSADEFSACFSKPAQDVAEARADASKAWDKYYEKNDRLYDLEDENRRLKAENERFKQLPVNFTGSYGEVQIRALLVATHAGQKIAAIKLIREMLGLGLKEAKDLVELCQANGDSERAKIARGY